MKKILFVFGLMLTMIACGGNSTTTKSEVNDSTVVDTVVVDSTLIDTISID